MFKVKLINYFILSLLLSPISFVLASQGQPDNSKAIKVIDRYQWNKDRYVLQETIVQPANDEVEKSIKPQNSFTARQLLLVQEEAVDHVLMLRFDEENNTWQQQSIAVELNATATAFQIVFPLKQYSKMMALLDDMKKPSKGKQVPMSIPYKCESQQDGVQLECSVLVGL